MRRLLPRTASVVVAVGAGLLLAACAPAAPSIDLDAAREWVEGVQADESDGPGAAGTATLLVEPGTPDETDGEGDPAGSIRLDFASEATLTRADAACFGGGSIEAAVTVFTVDGDAQQSDSYSGEIPCDEKMHEIDLGGTPGSSVLIEARGDSATYAYVRVMQGLTISND